ncbi:MAG: 6-phosphogluconolactonase [Glaciecola sp.]|jgi:6-phosphogluconolactonase
MPLITNEFSDAASLTESFADRIVGIVQHALVEKGHATIVVSGGRTPIALFQTLSQADIAWENVTITLADDRWVDVHDDASNDKLVRTHLLQNHAAKASFITLKHDVEDAADAVELCEAALAAITLPFDVLILGMGEDGHTASLFPCSEQIAAGLDLNSNKKYIAVQPTTAPHQRMSLTLPALLASRNIFLHLTGESKKDVILKALQANEIDMPIKAVLDRASVNLMWAP